jgi:hypothetical protein
MWGNYKLYQFDGVVGLTSAFFANVLGSSVSITKLYEYIVAKQKAGDSAGVYYGLARLVRVLIDF